METSEQDDANDMRFATNSSAETDGNDEGIVGTLIPVSTTSPNLSEESFHILQATDPTQVLNAETLQALDGIVITVAAPTEGDANIQNEFSGKIWQVVPSNGNSSITHIIAVGETPTFAVTPEESEVPMDDFDSGSLTNDTLTSMLLSNPVSPRIWPADAPTWALKLRDCEVIGSSFRGWVASETELDLILTFHKQQTQSFWGTRQSPSSSRHTTRLMWKSQYVPLDGIPFINSGSRAIVMECQFGPRRRGNQTKKKIQRMPSTNSNGQFKQTCPARIYIKRVRKFPEFVVDLSSDRKHLRSAMDKAFQELKNRGFDGHGEDRWYVQLPSSAAHEFHEANTSPKDSPKSGRKISTEANLLGTEKIRIHPKVVEKIQELVQNGETRVYAIRKQLRKFVERSLFDSESEQIPERHNLCFFPTVHDIQNHIYQAQKELVSEHNSELESAGQISETISTETMVSIEETQENSAKSSAQVRAETITVTLAPRSEGENPVISRIETHLNDGSLQITSTLSPEMAQALYKLHPNIFSTNLIQDSYKSDTTEQLMLNSDETEPSHDCEMTTVTMGEGGEILHVENGNNSDRDLFTEK